jgi:hypothetical protein
MLCRIDQQQFLSGIHLHQVPNVDSAKLLNVEKIKLNTLAFYAKKKQFVVLVIEKKRYYCINRVPEEQ